MGKDDDSGERAAQQANQLTQQGIDELRRQFGVTQQNIDPFIQAGASQLPGLQEGATIDGFGSRLAQIFGGGALDPLIEERTRAAQGQLSAGGLTRSGTALQEISAIPQDIGFAIEQLLTGRSQGLANQGQGAALGLGQLGQGNAANIASLFQGQGQQLAAGVQQDTQNNAQGFGDILGLVGTLGGAALGGPLGASLGGSLGQSIGGGVGSGGGTPNISGIGSSLRGSGGNFFSDRNLKRNVEPIGKIGPLTLHQWDWIPETEGMIISTFPTMGFLYDEVKEHFPEHVKTIDGFGAVEYFGLLDKIENSLVLEGV